jgi:hypothetical protein
MGNGFCISGNWDLLGGFVWCRGPGMDRTSTHPIRLVGGMIQWPQSGSPRKGRGGRRPGAGRKPNHLKQLALPPIGVAEIVARRHPESERLSAEELAMLHTLTKKLAEPSPDGPRNQKESNREVFEASTATTA